MLANLLVKPGKLVLREVETPRPSTGELLIRVKTGLTCGTDLKAFQRGHPFIPVPTVLGHEFAGIVEAAGRGVRRVSPGTAVMAVHSAPCGKCWYCAGDLHNLCDSIMTTKALGAFAEYILLPRHVVKYNVFPKPEHLSFAEAAFLEPLSCVVHSIRSAGVARGDTAVVAGAGPVGLLHLMVLKTMGLRVIMVDRNAGRLRKALSLGADDATRPGRGRPPGKTGDLTDGRGADVVFECTGSPEIWEKAVWFVRRGGTVILFGGCREGARVCYDAGRIHYDEITLKGAFHYRPSDVKRAYTLLSNRTVEVEGLISGEYPLRHLNRAFRKLLSGQGIKYAIIP